MVQAPLTQLIPAGQHIWVHGCSPLSLLQQRPAGAAAAACHTRHTCHACHRIHVTHVTRLLTVDSNARTLTQTLGTSEVTQSLLDLQRCLMQTALVLPWERFVLPACLVLMQPQHANGMLCKVCAIARVLTHTYLSPRLHKIRLEACTSWFHMASCPPQRTCWPYSACPWCSTGDCTHCLLEGSTRCSPCKYSPPCRSLCRRASCQGARICC